MTLDGQGRFEKSGDSGERGHLGPPLQRRASPRLETKAGPDFAVHRRGSTDLTHDLRGLAHVDLRVNLRGERRRVPEDDASHLDTGWLARPSY